MKQSILDPKNDFIRVIEPDLRGDSSELMDWALANREAVNKALLTHGGILCRGFDLTVKQYKNLSDKLFPEKEEATYIGGCTSRVKLGRGLYRSTRASKEFTLRQHHEMAYLTKGPSKILFYCEIPPLSGGETPITSTRAFMNAVDGGILSTFKEKKVMYRRSFPRKPAPGYGRTWSEAFETPIRKSIEDFCRSQDWDIRWQEDGSLKTLNVSQGVAKHPITGEELWFNQGYNLNKTIDSKGTFSESYLRSIGDSSVNLKALSIDPEDFPIDTRYGDGSFIEPAVLSEIEALYSELQVTFKWQQGDCLILDNKLSTHGRLPYEGDQRRILVTWKSL